MDAKQRLRNLKSASWGPPLGGSFAQLREGPVDKSSAKLPEPLPEHIVGDTATSSG